MNDLYNFQNVDVDYITSTEIPSYTKNNTKNGQVNNIQKDKEFLNSFIPDLSGKNENKLNKNKKVGNCNKDVICIKIQEKDFSDFPRTLIASIKNNETKRDEEKVKNELAQKQKLTENKKTGNFSALTKEAIRRKLNQNKNKKPQVNNTEVENGFQLEIEQYLLPTENQIINR